uniref:C-type lectin domain-containing protein n=1 Tax=Panagrolaimus davidi TaxID=227884 RepID=A0A914QX08_9BILA
MKEIIFCFILSLAFVFGDISDNQTPQKTGCQSEWTYFHGSGFCYKIFVNENWNDAEKICVKNGGHLSSIQNKAEAFFIAKLGQSSRGFVRPEIYIGSFTSKNDGLTKWQNNDSTPFIYHYWGPKDPSDHPNEKCVEMHLFPNAFGARTGDLNNVNCEKVQNFICKAMPF